MSFYTAVIHYCNCAKCGGIGSVYEWGPCPHCDGDEEGCEHCCLGEAQVSSVLCQFCDGGLQDDFTEQFYAADIDAAVTVLKSRLYKSMIGIDPKCELEGHA